MVLGEPQILGQVKHAFTLAQSAGSVGWTLNSVMNRAFYVAKRVRSETGIAGSAVSVSYAAVELAKKIFNVLKGKTVLIMGAGKMSELAAKHLTHSGVSRVLVWNRSHPRAMELARLFDGEAILPEELFKHIQEADIIISSTGAPHFILNREDGERIIHLRKNRPVFVIDIAVPRDVDPELNDIEGIFVYDIDDLQQAVSAHLADRGKEAERAERIVDFEVEAYVQRQRTRDVVPMIVSLQDQFENIRQAEIDRVRGRLGKLTAEQEQALDALTQGIVKKILHMPITTLKTAARDPQSTTVSDLVRRMFKLDEADTKPPGSGSGTGSGDAS
jgi:glutamyl-tRNA reductase